MPEQFANEFLGIDPMDAYPAPQAAEGWPLPGTGVRHARYPSTAERGDGNHTSSRNIPQYAGDISSGEWANGEDHPRELLPGMPRDALSRRG